MSKKEIHIGDGDRIKYEQPFPWGLVIVIVAALVVVGGIAAIVLLKFIPSQSAPSQTAISQTQQASSAIPYTPTPLPVATATPALESAITPTPVGAQKVELTPEYYMLTLLNETPGNGTITFRPAASSVVNLEKGSILVPKLRYKKGTIVRLTAEPRPGYKHDRWEGDASGSEKSINITMDSHKTVTPIFSKLSFNINIDAMPLKGGTVDISPNLTEHDFGTTVNITAVPSQNYVFNSWSGDASGSQNPLTITVDDNKNIIANYSKIQYALKVSVSPPGSGSISPVGGTYEGGKSVTLKATPAAGYDFNSWSGDASGTKPTLIMSMDSNKSITVNFSKIKYTLSVSVNPSGSASISPKSGSYNQGTRVTLTAKPNPGWKFRHWSGTDDESVNPATVTMTGHKKITAFFAAKIKYTLSTSVNPPGSGNISPNSGSYDHGTIVTLSALPAPGGKFVRWSGTDNDSINPTTITMTSSKTIIAYFTTTSKDTDGDGLTDEEERQIGTNPSYADTDKDGLSDYQEVKVKKTNPLNPDTDGDGIKDGNDLFPLYDAYVQVAIKQFQDTSAPGQGPDGGGPGDPYFKIWVDGLLKRSITRQSITYINNPFSASFNVPDDNRIVTIRIEVGEDDTLASDDYYDVGSAPGSELSALDYIKRFDVLGRAIIETSDGAADGSLRGPQAKIVVEIKTVLGP